DANSRADCRTGAVVNSVQDFWRQEFERRDASYTAAQTVLFSHARPVRHLPGRPGRIAPAAARVRRQGHRLP
ncbi:hypothetical protein HET64_35915, partial [Streptomyces sp. McG3]|nr:hypothetical protein [Streptomyces sp. McG3]